jgi:5'-phosphate synthase pdxT subunit
MEIKVGVLALQGAFREHINAVRKCGVYAKEIKLPEQIACMDGLIIPGGESTTINKLLKKYGFKPYLDNFYKKGKPIFGTCAGLIILSNDIKGENAGLGYIDITAERNAYGRQIDSFEESVNLNLNYNLDGKNFNAVFIRAPRILKVGGNVKILGKLNGNIIMARENNILVSVFHPELEDDTRVHQYFIEMIKELKKKGD